MLLLLSQLIQYVNTTKFLRYINLMEVELYYINRHPTNVSLSVLPNVIPFSSVLGFLKFCGHYQDWNHVPTY